MAEQQKAGALRILLHDNLVGYLTGYENGRNLFTLAPEYIENQDRPTLTISMADEANFQKLAGRIFPLTSRMRVHPLFSNLLPEGALREYLAQRMKIHVENEFPLLVHLGENLPGAIQAIPEAPENIPDYAFGDWGRKDRIAVPIVEHSTYFSLAGVQMKFSMQSKDGRFHIDEPGSSGNWIVKTPSTVHKEVPGNEFTSMHLASLIGVDIPEIRMVETSALNGLPDIPLPDEKYAYAIKRFDRSEEGRIHAEDFSQITFSYAHDKYQGHSYENIGQIIYRYGHQGQKDVAQMARRLLANILIANGDAHKKNWSVLYPDRRSPVLAPAYDIVSTRPYMGDEKDFALKMGGTRKWYEATNDSFATWAERVDAPRSLIRMHVADAMDKARTLWPKALEESPMNEAHKAALRDHWRNLQADFRIET